MTLSPFWRFVLTYLITTVEGWAPVGITVKSVFSWARIMSVLITEISLESELATSRYWSSGVRQRESGCDPTGIEAITCRVGGSSTEMLLDPKLAIYNRCASREITPRIGFLPTAKEPLSSF